ncbi:endolytic transglycosylase MltG [Rhodoluna sp.]|uniref:endolytic transglycosylase MltG n=1 Tax=Rhodoluna sp. TaxID=1969481 RepID=UPI0025D8B07F|nr:endolytic transglycosylase MltG [Rhodoluna sp.]
MTKRVFVRRRLAALLALVLVLAVGSGVAYVNRGVIRAGLDQLLGNDYSGPGVEEVKFTVNSGDTGEVIAQHLVDAGITKNFRVTYQLILDLNPTFYPGTFAMKTHMTSAAAIAVLSDRNSASLERAVIKEGLRASNVFAVLSEKTGMPVSDFQQYFKQPTAFGLSANLPSIEGYLFPATYTFVPGSSAKEILQVMVDRMQQELDKFGIAAKDANRVLTLASVVQKEARIESDFFKVSATFLNRIKAGMRLQSDATVSYGVNGSTVSTSAADRANDNPWNTYLQDGLPVAPISAPGALAIDAALHPANGKWLYFCTINLETGETVFSNTYAEHEKAVALWRAWMKENPGYE